MNMKEFNSRGESGQDFWAFHKCGRKLDGTFIDIGSNEPIRWNNTYALEEVGWTGVLVEIDPQYAALTREKRKSTLITADARAIDWPRVLYMPDGVCTVDYLSLDIDENEERDLATTILTNLFNAGVSWRCATIEHDGYRYGDNPRLKIRDLMQANGYTLARANVEIGQYRGGYGAGNGKPFEDWWVR